MEFRQQAIASCKSDCERFFDLFAWTFDPREKKNPAQAARPFLLYNKQRIALKVIQHCIDNQRPLYIAKSRARGISWLIDETFLWYAKFTENFHGHIGSQTESDVDKIGDMQSLMERIRWSIREAEKATPGVFGKDWEKVSKELLIKFPNSNSQITGQATVAGFGRQKRFKAVHLSEFAQIDESLQSSISEGIPSSSPCVIYESTPNGVGGAFAESVLSMLGKPEHEVNMLTGEIPWDENLAKRNLPQKPLLMLYHWTLDDECTEDAYYIDQNGNRVELKSSEEAYTIWRSGYNGQTTIKVRSPWYDAMEEQFKGDSANGKSAGQELDIDFVSSGSPVFDPRTVQIGLYHAVEPIQKVKVLYNLWSAEDNIDLAKCIDVKELIVPNSLGSIHIWEQPDPRIPYGIFADAAQCLDQNSDYQAFAVINPITNKIVCTGIDRWRTHEYAKILCIMGYYYNEALLAVESNDVGAAILMLITKRTGFSDKDEFERLNQAGSMWYNRLYVEWSQKSEHLQRGSRLGWRTGRAEKRVMISGLDKLMSVPGQIDIPDKRFWNQAQYFYNLSGGKMGAKMGHDDMVMAVAGAAQIAAEARLYKPEPEPFKKNDELEMIRRGINGEDEESVHHLFKQMVVKVKNG